MYLVNRLLCGIETSLDDGIAGAGAKTIIGFGNSKCSRWGESRRGVDVDFKSTTDTF